MSSAQSRVIARDAAIILCGGIIIVSTVAGGLCFQTGVSKKALFETARACKTIVTSSVGMITGFLIGVTFPISIPLIRYLEKRESKKELISQIETSEMKN